VQQCTCPSLLPVKQVRQGARARPLAPGGRRAAYTMATPVTTVSTERMTGLVNTRPSQQRSTRQTKGMISSFAICTGRSRSAGQQGARRRRKAGAAPRREADLVEADLVEHQRQVQRDDGHVGRRGEQDQVCADARASRSAAVQARRTGGAARAGQHRKSRHNHT